MPRYYTDVFALEMLSRDSEGGDYADLGEARAAAMSAANEIMADSVRRGDRRLVIAMRIRGDGPNYLAVVTVTVGIEDTDPTHH